MNRFLPKNKKMSFWLLSIVGGLFVLDVLSRIVLSAAPHLDDMTVELPEGDDLMPFDTQTLWRLEPNRVYSVEGVQYRINSLGMRGPEPEVVNPKNRILVIGDSSTFGFGVEYLDTYGIQLGDCLDSMVWNGGVSGYSSEQTKAQLPSLLSRVQPKWVVIANLWSDMMKTNLSDREQISNARTVQKQHMFNTAEVMKISPIFRLLKGAIFHWFWAEPKRIEINAILHGQDRGMAVRVTPKEYGENIDEMVNLITEASAQALILQLPTNRSKPHPEMEEIQGYKSSGDRVGRDRNVPVLDMDMVYLPLPPSSISDRFVDFVHPSPSGHADIATELCEIILLNEE